MKEIKSTVRKNMMKSKHYSPYCGNMDCYLMPRTKWNGEQFICPYCGWKSSFQQEFINKYKRKHNLN